MGCINSKEAPKTPAVQAKGVSEQHIDLHLANKRDKRNNVFTAGGHVEASNFSPKNIPKTKDQDKCIRKLIDTLSHSPVDLG